MILHDLSLSRPADEADLNDITRAKRTGPARWFECEQHGAANCLDLPLSCEPTEKQALAIRRRLVTADAADESHLSQMLADVGDPLTPSWARSLLRAELARYGEG